MPNWGGAAQGYVDSVNQGSARDQQGAQIQHLLAIVAASKAQQEREAQDRARAMAARQGAGQAFMGAFAGPPPGMIPQPPPPGLSSPGGTPNASPTAPPPNAPPEGAPEGPSMGNMASLPAPPGVAGPPMAATSPSWQPLPKPPVAPPGAGGDATIPAPPVAAPKGALNPTVLAEQWRKEGVDPGQVMDRLDALTPFMTAQSKAELEQAKVAIQVQSEARKFAQDRYTALLDEKKLAQGERKLDDAAARDAERARQMDERIEQGNRRLERLIGGGGDKAPTVTEVVDPADPSKSIKIDARTGRKIGDAPRSAAGRPLPAPLQKQLTEAAQIADATQRFVTTFQPEFAGKKITGGLGNKVGLILGDDTGQSQWWQDYELHQSEIRNKLFGSALTASEIEAWKKSAIEPRMDPKQVKINLERRDALEQRAIDRLMTGAAVTYNKDQIEAFTGRKIGDPNRGVTPRESGGKIGGTPAAKNAKGWVLMKDAAGNQAYVSPDGKEFEEAK